MRGLRRLAFAGVKQAAAVTDLLRPPPLGVTVLIYHRVGGGSGVQVDLPVALFEEQCEHLAAHATVLSLGDALAALRGERPLPPRAVVITFDDGTADLPEHAVPILVRHRLPATIFVATDFVERSRPFPNSGTPMSWQAAADACSTGLVDIGSHTHTHRVLADVDAAEAADELDRSIGLIQDRLGREVHDFAYPKAVEGSVAAATAVAARFRSAALAGGRANPVGADPQRLLRTPVQVSDGMHWFRRKAAGGMALESALRARLDARRYQGAVT